MNFFENELLKKDNTLRFLACCEVGKPLLKFHANFSEVFEVFSFKRTKFDLTFSNLVINMVRCCTSSSR